MLSVGIENALKQVPLHCLWYDFSFYDSTNREKKCVFLQTNQLKSDSAKKYNASEKLKMRLKKKPTTKCLVILIIYMCTSEHTHAYTTDTTDTRSVITRCYASFFLIAINILFIKSD